MRSCLLVLLVGVVLSLTASGYAAQFQDLAPSLGMPGAIGAAWGDYTGDGYPDLFVTGNANVGYGARLFRNDGDLAFTEVSAGAGFPVAALGPIGPAWADYDSDGVLDLFVSSDGLSPQLYHDTAGAFTDVASAAGVLGALGTGNAGRTAAWCDYDGDNWLDLFVCSGSSRLLRGNGDGTFSEATTAAGMTGGAAPGSASCCAWGDYDSDGHADLVVTRPAPNRAQLFHNNGDGTFTEVGGFLAAVVGAVGVAWGDYDQDGELDLYLTSGAASTQDWLFHNDGGGAFHDVAATAGMAGDASSSDAMAWADYDNDGLLDIYVGNTQTGGASKLYHNVGPTFTDVAASEGMAGTYHDEAAAWADMDLDGRVDLFQAGQLVSRLFHNVGPAGNWLRVRALTSATGDATDPAQPTRDAIGARVDVLVDDGDLWWPHLVRTIDGGSSFLSQGEQVAQFGLGTSPHVIVNVAFPDGSVVGHRNVAANQEITIRDVPAGRHEIFPDVPLDFWAYPQILAVKDAGIVSGYLDGTYGPGYSVTRDQMAVYIARALAGGDAYVPTSAHVVTFADVPADYWAFNYIEYCYDAAVVQGYADGYHPTEVVNRAQMAVYVARSIVDPTGEDGLAGYTPPTTASFPDVATDYWAYKHIEYCKAQSIVSGYWDGYHPADTVTRDQMAVYVARAFELPV